MQHKTEQIRLTGRINAAPHAFLHEWVLEPQFRYELEHLFRWYILIEKVLLLEYERMGLLKKETVADVATILKQMTPETLIADPKMNMSDISFAIEQYVSQRVTKSMHNWHVDRSRNDLQACAQLLFCRDQVLSLVELFFVFAHTVHHLALKNTTVIMPGYTHYQAAQVISVGFYLAALSEQGIALLKRLLTVYDEINLCPLGAGAMAGQQLLWDRYFMAKLLGFAGPQRHALISVASRDWVLKVAGEFSIFSIAISRFVTDFISWGSSAYGFIELPDELSSISSAMPQKKNYPILERIRGKASHISAFYLDFMQGQHNTPYMNLVEVSKEAGSYLISLFRTIQLIVQLFIIVVEHVHFRKDQMKAACEQKYIGGFTLANYLTLQENIPYRTSQAIAGYYIAEAMRNDIKPWQVDSALLQSAGRFYGYQVHLPDEVLQSIFNVEKDLHRKQSLGSSNPNAVEALLAFQQEEIETLRIQWDQRRKSVEDAYQQIDCLL